MTSILKQNTSCFALPLYSSYRHLKNNTSKPKPNPVERIAGFPRSAVNLVRSAKIYRLSTAVSATRTIRSRARDADIQRCVIRNLA
jgi:hypothetical protein